LVSVLFVWPWVSPPRLSMPSGWDCLGLEPFSFAAGPYYLLGIIGTVPRAYDILRSTMEWKGEKIEIKEWRIGKN
jgi:hypothetical protein